MTYLNIIEKLKVLFNTLLDSKILLILLCFLVLSTFLRLIKKLSNKNYIKCIILYLIVTLLICILDNEKALSNTFNDFTTLFFRGIYFPSVYVYLEIITIILISTIVTLLNKSTKKVYKIINLSSLIINSMLFVLILNIIAKNKIDVFSINSLYTNTPLVVILEISTGLFLIWIAALLIVYTTNCIIDRMPNNKENKVNYIPVLETSIDYNTNVSLTNIKQPVEIVNTIEPIKTFNNNYKYIVKENNNDNISFQEILEKVSKIEQIDGNIDDIDIFEDNKYNVYSILS